jgi:DNA repair protein RecO (recombination protein O)
MPVYSADAIVLRRIALGEKDKIVTLLTRQHGKLKAVAKGARRPGNNLAGATELFIYSKMQMAEGRNLDIVTQCDVKAAFTLVRGELELMARATYLCELIDRLTEDREPNQEIFDLLLSTLYLMQRGEFHPDSLMHSFELRLLSERGYEPVLDRCARCGDKLPARTFGFSPSSGGTVCGSCRYEERDSLPMRPSSAQAMQSLMVGEPADAARIQLGVEELREIGVATKRYVRACAQCDIKSMEFVEMLRTQSHTPAGEFASRA